MTADLKPKQKKTRVKNFLLRKSKKKRKEEEAKNKL